MGYIVPPVHQNEEREYPMTKADLAEVIQDNAGMTKADALDALEGLLEVIKTTLEAGEDLKIANFGKFEVRQKNARLGRNPQTGEAMTIEERQIVTFRPAALLKKCLNDGSPIPMAKPLKLNKREKGRDTWEQESLPL
jgi:integration host factor subunit alpha